MNRKPQPATHPRWRITATLLLGLLLTMLFAPGIAAATTGDDASLPACCRAHGRHHCAMGRAVTHASTDSPVLAQVTEGCPCPACAPAASHGGIDGLAVSAILYAELRAHPTVRPQVEARRRIALDVANGKRGPPPHTLSA